MEIYLNGERFATHCTTLDALIRDRGCRTGGLVVELNREIVLPGTWKEKKLAQGDEVELLGFVGGG